MEKLDCIFLDLDGPILEGKKRHYKCYTDIVNKYGGELLDIDSYWNLKTSKVSRNELLLKSKFQSSYEIFFNEWMSNIESKNNLKLDSLKPNVIKTLQFWKSLSIVIILVTMRQNRDLLITQLKELNVFHFFDEIIDCPPQRINTKFEALKNKKFRNAIFIGDTEEDTNTAKLLDIKSIGILNGLRKKDFLDADYYYNEIKDINFKEIVL